MLIKKMKTSEDKFPDVIRIESAGLCNFKCIHCPTGRKPNRRKALDPSSFASIVDQFVVSHTIPRVVVLYHGGEPLLNKHLATYVQTLKRLGVSKTVITTNASLLDAQLSEALILAGLDEIKVSFDGESPAENDAIRRNGNFFNDAGNVKTLCRIKKELGLPNPSMIISNVRIFSRDELSALNKQSDFVPDSVPKYLLSFFEEHLGALSFQSFPAMVWPGYADFGENIDCASFPATLTDYCDALFETFTILTTGDVVPCCYDITGELIMGNVFESKIEDIWQSPQFRKLRNDFRSQRYVKLCRKCTMVVPRYLCMKQNNPFTEEYSRHADTQTQVPSQSEDIQNPVVTSVRETAR